MGDDHQQQQQGIEAPALLIPLQRSTISHLESAIDSISSSRSRSRSSHKRWSRALVLFSAFVTISIIGLVLGGNSSNLQVAVEKHKQQQQQQQQQPEHGRISIKDSEIVQSEKGVVAADDARCSEVGAAMLRKGGHAVDAAVATALCLGVVSPISSGIGGGAFMIVYSPSTAKAQAFDSRECAPAAATEDMYEKNPQAKSVGALSMGVPGELAGLHEAWLRYGRLPWRTLFEHAIKLARDGFVISPYLGHDITSYEKMIRADPGLTQVFAPNGELLLTGDTCHNLELAQTLEAVAEQGPRAFYDGEVGEKLIDDVKKAGGILTMDDLRNYRVQVTDALSVDVMGYTFFGMPPPSSGTLGLSLVLNILDSYGSPDASKGALGLHRTIEALKHMFAIRMNLGDPAFVNIDRYTSDMTSPTYAKKLQEKILDNTTFPSDYYLGRWSQLRDNGTSHFCIVDLERNVVSMTTTVNYVFGAGVLSPSTGIVLNNEMDDFSTPTEINPDKLPPAPANFIRPGKRPLSSMTPLVILKDNQLVGAIGGSGGLYIIPAVLQVFLNHFVLGMEPLAAVQNPRVYHKLIPNFVLYENWTLIEGDHIELPQERKAFLKERHHQLKAIAGGAICQLVVQTQQNSVHLGKENGNISSSSSSDGPRFTQGILTAVSDPRKDGRPAAI
ncbi:Gamma-glutamyltranspeptidase 3 [Dionaea muscipula]